MVNAISSVQGTSATHQANFAAMQQQLIQQLFQAAGGSNGSGTISQSQFENFYNQFMGSNSTAGSSSSTTAAADQLYQQLNTSGNGLNQTQFASALKQMMSQKAQGHHHHHHVAGASGLNGNSASQNVSQAGASLASGSPTTRLAQILAASSQNTAGQSAQAQNNGGIQFIA